MATRESTLETVDIAQHPTHTIQLSDNHTLSYREFGDPDGDPVLYLHGLPSSSAEAGPWHAAAVSRHLRIIAPDRPGMGNSTTVPDRSIADFPAQVRELLVRLGVGGKRVSVIGVSGGGPYALACAAQQQSLFPGGGGDGGGLRAVAVLGGNGPRNMSQAGMSLMQRFAYSAMDWVPGGLVGWFWDALIGKSARNPDKALLRDKVSASLKAQGGVEEERIAADPGLLETMTEALRGAFMQGSEGYVVEATLISRPWGFDLKGIKNVPVSLWYGGKDDISPASAGKAMADEIEGAHFFYAIDGGHCAVTVGQTDEVLTWLAKQP